MVNKHYPHSLQSEIQKRISFRKSKGNPLDFKKLLSLKYFSLTSKESHLRQYRFQIEIIWN